MTGGRGETDNDREREREREGGRTDKQTQIHRQTEKQREINYE